MAKSTQQKINSLLSGWPVWLFYASGLQAEKTQIRFRGVPPKGYEKWNTVLN